MFTIVADPEATLKVLDPHVGDAGVRTGRTSKALVLSSLTKARLQVRGHGEVGQRLIARAGIENDATTLHLIGGEEDVGAPQARALEGQTGVIDADLAGEFPGSGGNIDRLGGSVYSRVHRRDERIIVGNTIAGLRIVVVGDAHGAFGALDGRCSLLELDEIDAVLGLILVNLDDAHMVALLDLTVKQRVHLVEAETLVCGTRGQGRLVVDTLLVDVLPGGFGGQGEGRSKIVINVDLHLARGVIGQGEAQVEGVGCGRRSEIQRGVLVLQGHVGLARGLNSRRFEVVGAFERRPVGSTRLLGLVSRVGDGRAVLVVGRNRTGDQCGHQRNDAEQSHSCNEGSSFHMSLKPLFMP